MLQQLKALDVDRVAFEELVALQAFGKRMVSEYEELDVPTPDWLESKMLILRRAIAMKLDDQRRKDVREMELELERLTPTQERREALKKKLAQAKRQLQEV